MIVTNKPSRNEQSAYKHGLSHLLHWALTMCELQHAHFMKNSHCKKITYNDRHVKEFNIYVILIG